MYRAGLAFVGEIFSFVLRLAGGYGMRHYTIALVLAGLSVPASTYAQGSSAREAATTTCKSLVKTEVVDKRVLGEIDPTALCQRLDQMLAPPTTPRVSPTLRRITFDEQPAFYDRLRQILKKQQRDKVEVWVTFDGDAKPTLASLQALGPENGFNEAGLMTWISKSKGYGNQFCRLPAAHSVGATLAEGGFNLLVGLFDKLIAKWNAARFYNPAKHYSVIAVYSPDPADNEQLVMLRFVPPEFLAPDCGRLLREAPPENLGGARSIPVT